MTGAKQAVRQRTGELVQGETQAAAGGEERQPWDQQPGEPERWFGRFRVFLQLGPARTLLRAYREANRMPGTPENKRSSTKTGRWLDNCRRWHWRERAQAWDVHQYQLLALSEHNARLARRSRRLALIEEQLERVCTALDTAGIDTLDPQVALDLFPQTRVFLRDLLAAERLEDGRTPLNGDEPDDAALITADDLRAAQRQLEQEERERAEAAAEDSPAWQAQAAPIGWVSAQVAAAGTAGAVAAQRPRSPGAAVPAAGAQEPNSRTLHVCTWTPDAAPLDLAELQALRDAAGLKFQRLLTPTRSGFGDTVRRARNLHRPVQLLQVDVPASASGIHFASSHADGEWLKGRLATVHVLLLTCWKGEFAGDWLDAVPFVVLLAEGISAADAAAFCREFWRQIGLGLEPQAALDETLTHCAPHVSAYVSRQ